jgi:hypothetical protein
MGAKAKVFVTLALVGACAVLALPSIAAGAARSGVTIHSLPGVAFKGYVFSPKPRQCARNRTVRVFRQKGKKQNRKRDIKVAKTTSAFTFRRRQRYKWETASRQFRPGDYYAQVRATAACRADSSKTVRISVRPRTRHIMTTLVPTTRSADFYYQAKGGVEPYTFRCKLDHKPYRRCGRGESDSRNYTHLSRGHHVFKVFAIGDDGKRDLTPAKRAFHFPR